MIENDKKAKILLLVNHEVDITRFRLELIQKIIEEDYLLFVLSPRNIPNSDIDEQDFTFIETKLERHGTSVFNDLKLLSFYFKVLKKHQPDLVLTFSIKPNIYGGLACRLLGIPYVVNITGLGTAVEYPGPLQHLTVFLYRRALKKVQKVFFQNTENQAFFEDRKIALEKHALLPGSGVNLDRFTPLPYPPEDTIEFVFISRIMKEKGIEEYLKTARAIRNKYSNTKFHICGFCEEAYEEILNQLHEDGIIIYHGMVDDVREVIKHTHCTIHPSFYPEGMSNVLLESSACARPIITTDRSGCREIVDEGINGFVVPICDTKSLIESVERFIQFPYEQKIQMGLAGRKKIEQEFDRQTVVDAYMNEIHELILEE